MSMALVRASLQALPSAGDRTWICSVSSGRLRKCDECSGGSSSGGVGRSGGGSALGELHAGVLDGLQRCVLRHGGIGVAATCASNAALRGNLERRLSAV